MSQEPSRTGGNLPPGAVVGDPAADAIIDRAGDLDYTNERLRQRERELLAEYERNARALQAAGAGGEEITGRGWAANEAVVVMVDASNRLIDLHLDPRALRLGSIENLRTAIITAFENAAEDVADQQRDHGLDAMGDEPVRDMLESMPELTALLPESSYAQFLADDGEPDDTTRPEPKRGPTRPDWDPKPNPYV
ncbi:YbaB/EbfC family nucleoid-associated protein [Propionibacteriaceae bacterium Y2011]|uniref:YbaB/EbfC family nucleoid-associated protein n=1 Tax=Microlunatus sp. Y2014 TaxID=3418488 RepID=UPI003B46996D